jgi:protein-disulfide isomerase
MNRFTIVILALLVAFAGVFWFSKREKSKDNTTNGSSVQTTNFTQGEGKKGVTLIEYGDFECPACGQYYPIVKEVKAKFGDDLKFQFRHFPLVQIHRNAMVAHRAAQAAGKQGKFFEMHDKLYEQQQVWTTSQNPASIFESYATDLGLNIDQFRTDAASSETNGIINADISEGQKIGANSTPTFVLNGKKVEQNPRDLESFIKLIEDEIAKQN